MKLLWCSCGQRSSTAWCLWRLYQSYLEDFVVQSLKVMIGVEFYVPVFIRACALLTSTLYCVISKKKSLYCAFTWVLVKLTTSINSQNNAGLITCEQLILAFYFIFSASKLIGWPDSMQLFFIKKIKSYWHEHVSIMQVRTEETSDHIPIIINQLKEEGGPSYKGRAQGVGSKGGKEDEQ